ncbi:MAG: DEAD/DEAH box helicase [Candidatus Rokubacteria bacterium]|nr:DEAD/DEAH box helicase [Candidatus Rokubacteria bacterium]
MSFAVGSLVRARGREWVVLPQSSDELLLVRPLGGTEDEVTGLYLPLETEDVRPAHFDLPDPDRVGDHRSCRLLRDAVRLGSRAGAGPFRSFARIAVEPRPYQLVPLLMALRLDPVRLLIADDVGVGKTIEACLVARELLDRGEVSRLAVLCPPHLAEQWQVELREKFHVDAELVLPGTAGRLERVCRIGQSLFEVYPHVVVSLDFIKSDRRRDEFVRTAPELIVVDEAHTCAFGYEGRGSRHQRHQLVKQLAADPARHLVLVTATPHSGKEEAFRSLLGLLKPEFADLPETLTGPEQAPLRRRLAAHFVQRRRADIEHFMQTDTPFPKREEAEETYRLTPEYRRLFDRVLRYARETVADPAGGRHRQRVRWWSALALLRALASSPAAAAATLRSRAPSADAETPEEADELGRRAVLDLAPEDLAEGVDVTPGGDPGEDPDEGGPNRRRLLEMARDADALAGAKDAKLLKAVELVQGLLRDRYRPILFCRFIATAEYVARELGKRLTRDVTVTAVTGALPPADREARVLDLAQAPKRVLVCTDCLSEGVNLQDHFDAVLHYDLSWNPTRHEQREGRVDRYGQARKTVRVLTYYGLDTQIDGIVLDVLIRKHKTIRSSLGIWVPVPVDTNAVVEAIFEGLLLREQGGAGEQLLPGLEEYLRPRKEELYTQWESAADREKRSRTTFAQESIKVDEVSRELAEARAAVGSAADVGAFTREALGAHRAVLTEQQGVLHTDLREVPRALRDALGGRDRLAARFELPVEDGVLYLSRTHPVVEALASHVMETALDPEADGIARRAGAIRTRAVARRTTLLLLRLRYDVVTRRRDAERSQLAEECRLVAFAGSPEAPEWLDEAAAETLLRAEPDANIYPEQAAGFVRTVVEAFDRLRERLEEEARRRAGALLDAHRRVREAAGLRGVSYRVTAQLPVDVLGIYVYLPVG